MTLINEFREGRVSATCCCLGVYHGCVLAGNVVPNLGAP